jgi:phosphoserine phosphatase
MLNIVYDFDGTLTNKPIPVIKFISKLGYTNQEFELMIEKTKDPNIYTSYFSVVLDLLINGKLPNNNETLAIGSKDIIYNNGLEEYLNEYTNIKHYILSSGIQKYLENITIAKYFNNIYGTTFKYDSDGNIIDLDNIVTDEKKVDFIKAINKDNNRDELDCSNLIYIGDGITDYYALKFVKENGGTSILVYTDTKPNDQRLLDISNHVFKADYSSNSDLVEYIKKLV